MKSISVIQFILPGCLVLFSTGCTKYRNMDAAGSNPNQQDYTSVSATIYVNQPYEYSLNTLGTDGSVVITTQALHYSFSTIYRATGGTFVYRYLPAPNYSGSDVVTLQTRTGTAGNNLKITNIIIGIDIFR